LFILFVYLSSMRALPAALKSACLADYINTTNSLKKIAEDHNVSYHTLQSWYRKEKWPEKRQEIEKDLADRTVAECAKIVSDSRAKVMRRHLKVGGRLEEAINKRLDRQGENIPPRDLADLGKALKASGDVSGRVVGLDLRKNEQVPQVNLLVNTNFTPVPAPQSEPKTVPAEVVDDESDPF
jgi:transposase-like protein